MALIEIAHPAVSHIEREVFFVRFAPDCMEHECRCDGRTELDACCRYGADVDLFEKERILARTREVQAVLGERGRLDPATWFADDEAEPDPAAPSGILTRTARLGPEEHGRCVFLGHDGRGCALHRAAVESGFDPAEIKPRVCRLFPLQLDGAVLVISDDFTDYSCAGHAGGPSMFRVMRPTLSSIFGDELVDRLDAAERALLDTAPRRLRVSY